MKLVKTWWSLLDGHKTHIGLVLYVVVGGLLYVGLITTKEAEYLGLFITAWTGYALRSAISKIE